ncbi:MAG: glutaredoxin family protein [Methanophagales archaeon]|nr:glutaredoxin family protein [Methanophagales archaeon]
MEDREKMIKVYSTKVCPHCKQVKDFLAAAGVEYEDVDITSAEALTELRMNGVFTLITPVLQVGSTFITHDELFDGEDLNVEKLKEIVEGKKEEEGA